MNDAIRIKMLYITIFVLCHQNIQAQLSHGEGEVKKIPETEFSCYVPKYFEIQTKPPGIIHKTSGTFIVIIAMPDDKKVDLEKSLTKEYFRDQHYTLTSFSEEGKFKSKEFKYKHKLYRMKYTIDSYEFERVVAIAQVGSRQYMIVGNFASLVREQVEEEVMKTIKSFRRLND